MAREEIQYVLPDGLTADVATEQLAAHLAVESERARTVDRRFYDTFDGRLHANGLTLTHEDGRLVLADAAGEARNVAEEPSPPRRMFAADLSPGPLRQALQPITDIRALSPIARVQSRMHPLRVLDDETKTVVRLRVEEPTLVGPRGARTPLKPRLRVLPVRGYDAALAEVRATLSGELGLGEAAETLQDEAVGAAGGTPGGVSTKLVLELRRGERADHAAVSVLSQPLEAMRATLPGTLADVDAEFLHDFRVAVRRTRSLQRQLRRVFPPDRLEGFRSEFRRLQQVTGAVRDLDVHLMELADFRAGAPPALAADLEPLAQVLAGRRRAELRRMVRALRAERTGQAIDAWESFLEGLVALSEDNRPDAARPIEEVAARRIRRVYGRMVKMGGAIDDDSPAEALHELRKKGKELRYLLEFFSSLYPGEVVKPMVKTLKSLQDVLGRHQDQEVQAATLRALRHELPEREGGAAALMAMGVLVERLQDQHAAARADFAERFAPFAAKKQRKLVAETFG